MRDPAAAYGRISAVRVVLRAQLGSAEMRFADVESLRVGSIVTLDRLAGEPVELICRGRCIAKGEVMIQDEAFAVRITEIVDRARIDEVRPIRPGRSRNN